LAQLEKIMTAEILEKWITNLNKQPLEKIELFMPKFKLATQYDLIPAFMTLGIEDAFKMDVADFRGMGWPVGDLAIVQIKHKAYVEVNEEGTEAAAATAVEMATKMMQRTPVFRADHPFLFVVRDNVTGSILFMGRVVDPGKE
jgi:serpin B